MIYSYPDYYKKFRCIADKCPDTCCSDWQIVIDDESLEKYRNYAGEYRQTLHRNIQWEDIDFKKEAYTISDEIIRLDYFGKRQQQHRM